MVKAAQSSDLQQAFKNHLEVTKGQMQRLEILFDRLGTSPGRKKCMGMECLIKETEEFLGQDVAADVMDAGLIANAQRVEHYEIAAYGTVRTYAEMMGDREAANLLQQTLDEEGHTNQMLTQLAERGINQEARR
jgi:ferritin-like metal-binding protein YciE